MQPSQTPHEVQGPLASPRPEGTALWLLIVVMALIIIPMIALSQILAYWRTDVVDDQMFGYYGWRILHGATIYRDVWDNKPPGIYWTNALGFLVGGDSYLGVVALCVAALAVAHAAFFVAAASVYARGAAALATILLSFFLTHGYYTGGTNRTETFLVMFELLAVAFYFRGFARDRWWKWYAAGLCCGLAVLYKQVGLAAWGAMGLHTVLLVLLRDLPWRTGLKRCLLLLVGAATSVGAAAAVLAWQGALRDAWFAVFTFNRAYVSTGDVQFPYNYVSWVLLKLHMYPILLLPLLMATAAVIHAFLWWFRPQHRPAEIETQLVAQRPVCPRYMLLFVVWYLAALYGAMLSPSHFRHYLVATIPPLLLLDGYLINVLRAEANLLRRLQQRAWVTAAFVVIAYFAYDAFTLQFEEVSKVVVPRVYQHEAAEWEVIGDAVARWTRPTDKIQCWGYMPGVYLRARRINASRFTTLEKVGQVRGGARFIVDEVESKLRTDPPAALAMSAGDYTWMKEGQAQGRRSDFDLGPWIDQHYRRVEEIPKFGNIYILKRDDLLPAPESQATRPDEGE
jgi:4-amino-4-deoxy-L-arabinose transferase-like glycosyltransferase